MAAQSNELGSIATKSVKTETVNLKNITFDPKVTTGDTILKPNNTIILALVGSEIRFPVQLNERVILGRQDPNNMKLVDIDLTPYSAYEKGVSRRHASLYKISNTLSLVDLGSNNGTHLNGYRLLPHQPRLMRNGDEVALGKLVFRVYFE
ncbi:MAG: FHA domain-containing protein [Chloroflexota bacterium]